MDDVLAVANSPTMWLLATLTVLVVVVQAIMFIRLAVRFSKRHQILTVSEQRTIYKTATVNSIGPAMAVLFLAIGLINVVGAPITLMRIGVVGSAFFELYAADQGAIAAGAQVGQASYDLTAYTSSVWAMTLGGLGWLISAFFMVKRLDNAQQKLNKSQPLALLIVGSVTPISIFTLLMINQFATRQAWFDFEISPDKLMAALASALSMFFFQQISKDIPWLKEWALGFSFVIGLVVGYCTHLFIV